MPSAIIQIWGFSSYSKVLSRGNRKADNLTRETPVGYALLKAKSSKILKEDRISGEDESAEGICSLYVPMLLL